LNYLEYEKNRISKLNSYPNVFKSLSDKNVSTARNLLHDLKLNLKIKAGDFIQKLEKQVKNDKYFCNEWGRYLGCNLDIELDLVSILNFIEFFEMNQK